MLSYPVNESHTIADLQAVIEIETGIPPSQQDIILANGIRMNSTDLAIHGYCDSVSSQFCLFLFSFQ